MKHITEFGQRFKSILPETCKSLIESNLWVHESVSTITLHGSRGLSANSRPNSDIDLTLLITANRLDQESDPASFLAKVLNTSLANWKGEFELDLAVAFDKLNCGLKCFEFEAFESSVCEATIDCIGLYKLQKGFKGFVTGPIVDVSKMYPLITIWNDF